MDETELEHARHEQRLEDLRLAFEDEAITQEEHHTMMAELEEAHQQRINAIVERGLTEKRRIEESNRRETEMRERASKAMRRQGERQFQSDIASLVQAGGDEASGIIKAAALVNAAIQGKAAAVAAWQAGMSTGGPFAPAVAAAYTAASLARTGMMISQLRSGGQRGASGGGAGAAIPAVATAASSGNMAAGGMAAGGSRLPAAATINIVGESFSRSQVARLIEAINELSEDGVRLVVA